MTINITTPPFYKTGSISLTQGSDIVNGTGTAWLVQVLKYGQFTVPGQAGVFYIDDVLSDTQIRLDRAWPYVSLNDVQYIIFSQHGSITDATLHNAIAATLDRVEKSLAVHVFQDHELDGSDVPLDTVGNDGDLGFIFDDAGSILTNWQKIAGVWTNETTIKGTDGLSLLSGSGAPSNGIGVDGDFYLDSATNQTIYGPKAGGVWPAGVSIKGDTGATGATGATGPQGPQGYSLLNGSGAPSNGIGVDGDFYLDSATNQTIYGPKAGGVWPAGVGIKGDTGAQGPQGDTGPQGDAFLVDVIDVFANRSTYDGEADGFIFYASDNQEAWQKDAAQPSGWLGPIPFGGGVTDGDRGDITVSGSGSIWTIDDQAVTLPKLAHIATGNLLGRNTAATGEVEVLSPATVRSMINVEDGATADQTGAEIKTALFAEVDTNNYDDAAVAKLAGIETNATADQTDAEIETAYNNQVTQVSAGEITAGTETAARRWSPADVKSAAQTHGGGGGASSADILALALRVADLEGDAFNIEDGVVDPFDDETDVDTAASTNLNYASGAYTNEGGAISDQIPAMTSSTTGGVTVTSSGHYSTYEGWQSCDNSIQSGVNSLWHSSGAFPHRLYIDFGSAKFVNGYSITASDSAGYNLQTAAPEDYTIEGSDDNLNWTVLDTQTGQIFAELEKKTFDLVALANYRYYRISSTYTNYGSTVLKEFELLFTPPPLNVILISKSFVADTAPATARLCLLVKPNEIIIPDTDLIGSVSRDDGTAWSAGTLIPKITYSDGTIYYEASGIDLSAQPSGTNMRYKIETANEKSMVITGAVFQWLQGS